MHEESDVNLSSHGIPVLRCQREAAEETLRWASPLVLNALYSDRIARNPVTL